MMKKEIIDKKTYYTVKSWEDLDSVLSEIFDFTGKERKGKGLSLVEVGFGSASAEKRWDVNKVVFVETDLSDMTPYKLLQDDVVNGHSKRKEKQ